MTKSPRTRSRSPLRVNIKMPQFLVKNKEQSKGTSDEDSSVSSQQEGKYLVPGCPRMDGSLSVTSDCTTSSELSVMETPAPTWQSSGEKGHHKHSPWVAQPFLVAQKERGANPHLCPKSVSEEVQNLKIAMQRAAHLPRNKHYSCSHIILNQEREKCRVAPMTRSRELDELCRWHAENMAAAAEGAFHIDATEMVAKMDKPCRRIGSNVEVGSSIWDIHLDMIQNKSMFNNILDRRFVEMGVATAKGKNGELYICQIFRG